MIDELDLLRQIYIHVLIPHAVYAELVRPASPEKVRSKMNFPPGWIELRTPSRKPDLELDKLNVGERDAILLATEISATQLIIDDLEGRKVAEKRGLRVTGTAGVLQEAAKRGLLDLKSAVSRLQQTNFYLSPELVARLLKGTP